MNEAKATRYQRLRRRGAAWAWLSAFGMLTVIALTPVSRWLEDWSVGVAASWHALVAPLVAIVVFTLMVVGLWELAVLPATLHVAFGADRAYLAGQESRWSALGGELQAVIVGAPFALLAALAVQLSVAVVGAWWWLAAACLLSIGLVAAIRVGPVVLGLIGTVRPLSEKPR